ncbi:hypothetical protein LTR17_001445 [Elasticomyces elasticus]|nr:hypothetical protein LTR17_001445 [Elasticomyces elasticus]
MLLKRIALSLVVIVLPVSKLRLLSIPSLTHYFGVASWNWSGWWSDSSKYSILLTGYSDSKCKQQAGKAIYTKSTWNCTNLEKPANGFVYRFAPHKGDDDPKDKHCRLTLYEDKDCKGRIDDEIREASAWLGWCMNRQRNMHGVENWDKWEVRSVQVDYYWGNHYGDPDLRADQLTRD